MINYLIKFQALIGSSFYTNKEGVKSQHRMDIRDDLLKFR